MKITSKILHLPPFISTTWYNVASLYMKEEVLIIALTNNESISIPAIPTEILVQIFDSYASFMEENQLHLQQNHPLEALLKSGKIVPMNGMIEGPNLPMIKMNLNSIDSIAESMQHNSAYANAPNLPNEILEKIVEITKIVASEQISNLPRAEPHCNCPHCQIARAIHGETSKIELQEEAEVKEEDLTFEQWKISEQGDQLYKVTNKLDMAESYNVFLGEPVGCTCGNSRCEHILAVLKS